MKRDASGRFLPCSTPAEQVHRDDDARPARAQRHSAGEPPTVAAAIALSASGGRSRVREPWAKAAVPRLGSPLQLSSPQFALAFTLGQHLEPRVRRRVDLCADTGTLPNAPARNRLGSDRRCLAAIELTKPARRRRRGRSSSLPNVASTGLRPAPTVEPLISPATFRVPIEGRHVAVGAGSRCRRRPRRPEVGAGEDLRAPVMLAARRWRCCRPSKRPAAGEVADGQLAERAADAERAGEVAVPGRSCS